MAKKSQIFAFICVLVISLGFALITAEDGVFNRQPNKFEILKTQPFVKGSVIEQQIEVVFAEEKPENYEEFESLKQKVYHDQYYRFGEINLKSKRENFQIEYGIHLAKYIIMLLISLVFLGQELPQAKRIWFILTILTIIYEAGLYASIEERDLLLDLFPQNFWLFEMVKYIHVAFTFTFLMITGVFAILKEDENLDSEKEKNKLLKTVSENMKTISDKVKNINDKANGDEDDSEDEDSKKNK